MISVFEPVCTQGEHAPFNAALLVVASELADDGLVKFFGDTTHVDRVAECLPASILPMVQFHAIAVANRHLRAFVARFSVELPLLVHVWGAARDARSEMLIITGVTEPGLLAIKLFFLFHSPRIPVLIVFHSVLAQFLYSAKRRFLLGAFVPKRIVFVVLGKHILRELDYLSPWIRRRISSITHPYIFDLDYAPSEACSATPKFAFIGLASSSKGFPDFIQLIEQFYCSHALTKGKPFYFIGGLSKDCTTLFTDFKLTSAASCLWYPADTEKLPLKEYRQRIAEMDYLIMPYSKEAYRLIFSGSSLDALMSLKPVIALRSSFFEVLFEQLGDIGYLCDDLEEMSKLVGDLISNPPQERYRTQIGNLSKGRSLFDPKAVADEIRDLVF